MIKYINKNINKNINEYLDILKFFLPVALLIFGYWEGLKKQNFIIKKVWKYFPIKKIMIPKL